MKFCHTCELSTIKVGLIGCGRNSDNHLRAYALAPGVRLVAVYDLDSITLLLQSEEGDGIGEYERYAKAPLLGFQLFTREGDRFDGDLFYDFVVMWSNHYPSGTLRYLRRTARDLAIPFLKWKS